METLPSPVYPTTFGKFPELPYELRLKIWSFIALGSRNVRIKYNMLSATYDEKKISRFAGYTSSEPTPVIFHICHESRAEANRTLSHKPYFGSFFHGARIYFDFSQDTLVFGDGTGENPADYLLDVFIGGGYHGADDFEMVERMSVDITEDNYARRSFIWEEIRQFTSLKFLTIYNWDPYSSGLRNDMMTYYRETLHMVAAMYPEWSVPQVLVKTNSGLDWGMIEREESEVAT
jgi:hypothetical protein